jgi:hypothetical protein
MKGRWAYIGVALWLLLVTAGIPSDGFAEEPNNQARSEQALLEGMALFKQQRCDQALTVWRRALRERGHWIFLVRIGDCHRVMGQPLVAAAYYRRALASAERWFLVDHAPAVEEAIAESLRARPSVQVRTRPGADIFINGRYQGQAPTKPTTVTPGQVTVRIEKPGYHSVTRRIPVREGRLTVELQLHPRRPSSHTSSNSPRNRDLTPWALGYLGAGIFTAGLGGGLVGLALSPAQNDLSLAPGLAAATLGLGLVVAGTLFLIRPAPQPGRRRPRSVAIANGLEL